MKLNRHFKEILKQNISFEKAIDSSDMTSAHWKQLVDIINDNYETYDGFVVLHGSDTMAYTASALSFMLQGLNKPVNDLSRGCTIDDIFNTVILTAIQAQDI